MKKNISYSALRDSEARSSVSFYQELSDKTLKYIGKITSHDLQMSTSISELKTLMGINYNALAMIVGNLKNSGYITMFLEHEKPAKAGESHVGPEDLRIKLTKEGLNAILKNSF